MISVRRFLPGVLTIVFSVSAVAQTGEPPLRDVTDPGVVTTRQAVTPAGVQSVFDGRVYGVSFGEAGQIWALVRRRLPDGEHAELYQMDWLDNRVISRVGMPGNPGLRSVIFDATNGRAIAGAVGARPDNAVSIMTSEAGDIDSIGGSLGTQSIGEVRLVNFGGTDRLLAALTYDNALAVIDPESESSQSIDVGVAPFAVAHHDGFAYVSNWGGTEASLDMESAPTGLAVDADQVAIDPQGVALPGTVSVIELAQNRLIDTIEVGRHPTAMALDENRGRLYVANTNDDSISVIDTQTRQVALTFALQPFQSIVAGIAPTALSLSPDGQTLYIACGGINAVAVYDLQSNRISGLIPTGWYPTSLDINEAGTRLAVGALLGEGSAWRDSPDQRYVHAYRGSVQVIDVPDSAQLASYTAAVAENNRVAFAGVSRLTPDSTPRAVPMRAGDPSLIKHIVYIIKENRTYDQVFGALSRGNGEPEFEMFGEDVTPNHRALAMRYVLLDNFYAVGGNSANGHQWVTQATEASYTLWPGYQGRSYPFDGTDPLAYASSGFIWDLALARGLSVAAFGEFAPREANPPREARIGLMEGWRDGETYLDTWNTTSPIPALDSILARNFPAYSMSIPDVIRTQIFTDHLRQWESEGEMPNLVIVQLPSDHTMGTTPGVHTPSAMVADNDLALGQMVEALSNSPFWNEMAIFVVEDDAQNGVDHVDGHRTVAMVISPYAKRGAVDSTFYSQPSMLKTIELILGLPTMSLFDLIANDMRGSFTDTPDFTPYEAITPEQDLFELNPPATALSGERLAGALASAEMRWEVPDAVPTETLNRIVWHEIKGWDVPYPEVADAVFSPYGSGDDDDDEYELEGDDDELDSED